MNFKKAAKIKLRFASTNGLIMVEDLYLLNITTLDEMAMKYDDLIQKFKGKSFLPEAETPMIQSLANDQLRLDILVEIIKDKLDEKDAAETRAVKAERKRKLLNAIVSKDEEDLNSMSKEDMLKELDSL